MHCIGHIGPQTGRHTKCHSLVRILFGELFGLSSLLFPSFFLSPCQVRSFSSSSSSSHPFSFSFYNFYFRSFRFVLFTTSVAFDFDSRYVPVVPVSPHSTTSLHHYSTATLQPNKTAIEWLRFLWLQLNSRRVGSSAVELDDGLRPLSVQLTN